MINTNYLNKCIDNLTLSFKLLGQQAAEKPLYDIYRSASIKEFELILEQSGNLLKKVIKPYFATNAAADRLFFKDIFRQAHKFGLLNIDEVGRWFKYRDSRNKTAHEYGQDLAKKTLNLIPQFIIDSQNLVAVIEQHNVIEK